MRPRQFRILMIIFSTFLALLMGFVGFADVGGVRTRTSDASLDLLTRLEPFEGDEALAKKMVLVDIDEQSLQLLGQWPWPRFRMAALVERIGAAEPFVVG